MHYYFNFSSVPQHFAYAYTAGTELLSNAKVAAGGTLTLEPWGVAIVGSTR